MDFERIEANLGFAMELKMSHTNSKNKLQEFCQKNDIELPKYTTECITCEGDNRPRFQSSVRINWDKIYNTSGSIENNKKHAELMAAKAMLHLIKGINKGKIKHYSRGILDICVYIDLENVSLGNFFEYHKFPDKGFYFVGVATSSHPSLKSVPEFIKIITVDSDHKDAADTLIIFDIGRSVEHSGGTYIIVTKDHFAAPLCEIINSERYSGYGAKAYRCKSMDDLDIMLDKHIN